MSIATKNGSIIVKDGKLAEDCGCCGGWQCYPTSLYCNVCGSLPEQLSLSVSLSSLGTFYWTYSTQLFGQTTYRNVRLTPSLSQTDFTLTKDATFVFGICSYSFNAGPLGFGGGSGMISPANPSLSMFSMAIGFHRPSVWASTSATACQPRYVYKFSFHQLILLLNGYATAVNSQNIPPTHPSFVQPENDSYSSPTSFSAGFMNGYAVPSYPVYNGFYALQDGVTAGECLIRLESPFSGTVQIPFFHGTHTGDTRSGQITLSLQTL